MVRTTSFAKIADHVQRVLHASPLSNQQIAARAHVREQTVRRWRRDSHLIGGRSLEILAAALGVGTPENTTLKDGAPVALDGQLLTDDERSFLARIAGFFEPWTVPLAERLLRRRRRYGLSPPFP